MANYVESIAKVKEMIHGPESIVAAKDIFARLKKEMGEIQMDPALSGIGIAQKQREAQARAGVELAKLMRENKKLIDAELAEAEAGARMALAHPIAEPDPEALREFNEQYGQLKTELMVFGGVQSAAKMLDFMQSVSDPNLAKTLADEFASTGVELSKHTIDTMRLRSVYENVKATAETDLRAMAKHALTEIESCRSMKPINAMVSLGAEKAIGESSYRAIMGDHEGYLRANGE